jgi:hypothetical protein
MSEDEIKKKNKLHKRIQIKMRMIIKNNNHRGKNKLEG